MVSRFELADNVVGILIESDLNVELINKVQTLILEKIDAHDEIHLFFEIRSGNEVTFKAFLNQMMFNFNNTEKFSKVAVVTDLDWIKNSMIIKDALLPTDIAHFSNKDRLNALAWISQ
ncbi:STAS/SEC14 domain-containing protein [Salegentibacter sp. F188]|uniref:STAS/SEC14 domain-containing protein n=1 Tax=Autumnicola patrickiae TaxID=3075591 RepID=A0ABU3E6C2_9FLAO|nr:STAS/SEC14 domain-containing protein [Salegentibacter sp. F188]MDT0691453.1 STAS/SEC14 domain-containing protein [Salegentibacter sp. F188]